MATSHSAHQTRRDPVLRVTRYDLVSSFLIAVVVALVVAVLWLTIIWVTNRLKQTKPSIELELIELPGGFEDGAVGETLRLDSPEDVAKDPSLADVEADETQVEETIENIIELSPNATQQVQQQWDADLLSTGKKGSADGTGRGPLGMGPGQGGMPREQRWLVRFANRRNLRQYARQLDFFGIELGALMPGGQLIYLSQLTARKPRSKRVTTGKGEKRLYMVRQSSGRNKADVQLFKLNVWDNLSAGNRCGACHGLSGPASPAFVREDDINLAYGQANSLVDLSNPPNSRLVTKVAGGHNCWLGTDSACGAVITAYIDAWASGTAAGGGRQIRSEERRGGKEGRSRWSPYH